MNDDLEQNHKNRTEHLIEQIESKDRLFRTFMSLTSIALLLLVLGVLWLQYSQLKRQQDDVNITRQHIQCIASFFAEGDRANKSISDINSCVIQNGDK